MINPAIDLGNINAAAALRQSEEKYRTLFNSMDEGVVTIELIFDGAENLVDFRYLEHNPALTKQTGLTTAILGRRAGELFPDMETYWFEAFERVAKTGEPERHEYYFGTLDSWFDLYISRVGGNGSHQIICVYNNITERKRTQERQVYLLKLSDATRPLFSTIEIQATVTHTAMQYFEADRCYFYEMEGDKAVILHDAFREGLPSVAGIYVTHNMPMFKAFLQTGKPLVITDVQDAGSLDQELKQLCHDLQIVAFIHLPILNYGQLVGCFCVTQCRPRVWTGLETELARETGERTWAAVERAKIEEALQQSEERFRIALEASELATWDWNMITGKVIWNDQHFLLFGMKPEKHEMSPQDFIKRVYPEDSGNVQGSLTEAIEKTGVYKAEFRIKRDDNGEVRWMNGYGRVTERKNGKATRMTGVMLDSTERKKMEQHKEGFLSIASHELKTPVTSLKAYTEILLELFEESEEKDHAELIKSMNGQVDRLTGLINNLLDTTKISEGQLPLHMQQFNLNDLVEERVTDMQRISRIHQLVVQPCHPVSVMADRERIGQVFTNLISNAIKYSPKGGEVSIGCEVREESLLVNVRDAGIGISQEVQSKVFERFFRVSEVRVQTYPGMGLGLYITAGIVQRHGGDIWVESEVGKGSTFYFTLPLRQNNSN